MTKQDLMTILKYEDTNAPLPLKVRVKYSDGSYELCDITNFRQWSDCFELIIRQDSEMAMTEPSKEDLREEAEKPNEEFISQYLKKDNEI